MFKVNNKNTRLTSIWKATLTSSWCLYWYFGTKYIQCFVAFVRFGLKWFNWTSTVTVQKIKFAIKDFFSKCDQIRSFLRIWSHLLKKSLMENFIFCAVGWVKTDNKVNTSKVSKKAYHTVNWQIKAFKKMFNWNYNYGLLMLLWLISCLEHFKKIKNQLPHQILS